MKILYRGVFVEDFLSPKMGQKLTVHLRSGQNVRQLLRTNHLILKCMTDVFKLWLSVQQNIGLYNIVQLATTAIATAASATTTSSATTYLLCKPRYI